MTENEFIPDFINESDESIEISNDAQTMFDLLKKINTKAKINCFAKDIEKYVQEGLVSGEEVFVFASILENLSKALKTDYITEKTVKAVDSFGKGDVCTVLGAKIEKTESSVKYDFSHSTAWVEMNKTLEQRQIEYLLPIENHLKSIEAIAKATKIASSYVNDEGEELQVLPCAKSSKTSPKITLATK